MSCVSLQLEMELRMLQCQAGPAEQSVLLSREEVSSLRYVPRPASSSPLSPPGGHCPKPRPVHSASSAETCLRWSGPPRHPFSGWCPQCSDVAMPSDGPCPLPAEPPGLVHRFRGSGVRAWLVPSPLQRPAQTGLEASCSQAPPDLWMQHEHRPSGSGAISRLLLRVPPQSSAAHPVPTPGAASVGREPTRGPASLAPAERWAPDHWEKTWGPGWVAAAWAQPTSGILARHVAEWP